jgi:hypothetical protein
MHSGTHTSTIIGTNTGAHSDTDTGTNCDITRLRGVVVCMQCGVYEGVQHLGDEAGHRS